MLTGNYTLPKILDIFNKELGYRKLKRKKQGGKPIFRSGIYVLLKNPFYVGMIAYGGEMNPGSQPTMITIEEYDCVQVLMGRKGKQWPKVREFAFTGMVSCGECGCPITAETKTKYMKGTGETKAFTYYHCSWKRKDIDCS